MKLPCEECLVFSMCKNKIKIERYYFIEPMIVILSKCIILKKYYEDMKESDEAKKIILRHFGYIYGTLKELESERR